MAKRNGDKLTDQQQRFIDEYLVDLNAKQAAIRAGYSPKSAQAQSSRLLSNVKVQTQLQARQAKISGRLETTAEQILRELDLVAMSSLGDVLEACDEETGGPRVKRMEDMTRDQLATLAEFTVDHVGTRDLPVIRYKIKQHNKVQAIMLALKRRGMLEEKISGDVQVTVVRKSAGGDPE